MQLLSNSKPKLSLSLNRNARVSPNSENKDPNSLITQDDQQNKENKPNKRPLSNTYLNTLGAAKRLKVVDDNSPPVIEKKKFYSNANINLELKRSGPLVERSRPAMLNGHHQPELGQYGGANNTSKKIPIATLSNLGNTCFLNSVLYTLRFAPRFLHNLHHLVADLASVDQKLGSIRLKSSSLGRGAAGLASSGPRSWSSKDLLSLGQSDNNTTKNKIQIATERLHEAYASLRTAETRCLSSSSTEPQPEPYAPDSFLSALRDVNSTFEGNRQQDAHELLVCILDNIRETCQALRVRATRLQIQENGDSNAVIKHPPLESDSGKSTLGLRKSWKKKKEPEKHDSPTDERTPTPPAVDQASRPGWDFVADDFEGVTLLRTTCLECETVTERKQAMCDICMPVPEEEEAPAEDGGEPFRAACVYSEYLRDQNKYWCERCLRYNEARRSVAYERLPRLLVMQLKRFSGGMEKITRHSTTPLELPCFCESCTKRPTDARPHTYTLWAVIMHLGQTLSGGHYIAYVRDNMSSEFKCAREGNCDVGPTTNAGSGGFMKAFFNRSRPVPAGCSARECCSPRSRPDAPWFACDDDLVKPISPEEFDDLLSPEPKVRSAATPYLLFYAKSEVG